jgi:hypothetical protein
LPTSTCNFCNFTGLFQRSVRQCLHGDDRFRQASLPTTAIYSQQLQELRFYSVIDKQNSQNGACKYFRNIVDLLQSRREVQKHINNNCKNNFELLEINYRVHKLRLPYPNGSTKMSRNWPSAVTWIKSRTMSENSHTGITDYALVHGVKIVSIYTFVL